MTASGRICTKAMARKRPPLKALARLINKGLFAQHLILEGKRPNSKAIPKIAKRKISFTTRKDLAS